MVRSRFLVPALALVVATLGFAIPVSATSCVCAGSFADNARRADLVVRAKAKAFDGSWGNGQPRYVDLAVSRVFAGDPSVTTVRIEGDDGNSLRKLASVFAPGSEWLLALQMSHVVTSGGKRTVVYEVSVCGSYALRVEDGKVGADGCEDADDGKPLSEVLDGLRSALAAPASQPTPTPPAPAAPSER
jgi:hypothetical protein